MALWRNYKEPIKIFARMAAVKTKATSDSRRCLLHMIFILRFFRRRLRCLFASGHLYRWHLWR